MLTTKEARKIAHECEKRGICGSELVISAVKTNDAEILDFCKRELAAGHKVYEHPTDALFDKVAGLDSL